MFRFLVGVLLAQDNLEDNHMLSIQELCDRYSIASRNSLYNRLNSLRSKGIDVELVKDKGKSFAGQLLIDVLDQQDKWLNEGGILDNFQPVEEVEISSSADTDMVPIQHSKDDLIDSIAKAIILIAENNSQQRDPLLFVKQLMLAAKFKIQLSSSQVKQIIGVKPRGEVFQRGSFKFIKVGKIGRESAWIVDFLAYSAAFRSY